MSGLNGVKEKDAFGASIPAYESRVPAAVYLRQINNDFKWVKRSGGTVWNDDSSSPQAQRCAVVGEVF